MRSRESVSGDGARSFLESNMFKLIKKLGRDERGVSALEYAVLAAVVVTAVVAAGSVLTTGNNSLQSLFTTVMTTIKGQVNGTT
jgi:pilus assembly protein Flp/PilA